MFIVDEGVGSSFETEPLAEIGIFSDGCLEEGDGSVS